VKCPSCSEETGPGHRFCFACGTPLTEDGNHGPGRSKPEKKKAAERVADAIVAYKRHGAPWVEIAREAGVKGLLSASLSRVAAAAAEEHPDLLAHASPEGTVTLGFSDIEGSTAANERLGDQGWLEVLKAHNGIVREQLKAHGGSEVKSLGDGFMVAFSSARKAVHWAVGVQRAFQDHAEEHPEEPIAVRIGLHTGEAIREDGDFFGADVALAARIAAAAQGGQILVSELVKELVENSGEFEFGRARRKGLKGISGGQVVHEVLWR
jgi:class 3 adenylate cyclase